MNTTYLLNEVLQWVGIIFSIILAIGILKRYLTAITSANRDTRTSKIVAVERGDKLPFVDFINPKGDTVSSGSLLGKETYFLFTSASCGACSNFIPEFELLQTEVPQTDFFIVSIDGPTTIDPRITNEDQFLWGKDSSASSILGINGTPSIIGIDPTGQITVAGHPLDTDSGWIEISSKWTNHRSLTSTN